MYITPLPPAPLQPTPLPFPVSWPLYAGSGFYHNGNDTTGDDPSPELPSNWSTLIGIVTAIVGNMLIALALNVQRYAHIRLHQARQQNREQARQALKKHAGNGAPGDSSGLGTGGTGGFGVTGEPTGTASDGAYHGVSRNGARRQYQYMHGGGGGGGDGNSDDDAGESSPLIGVRRAGPDRAAAASPPSSLSQSSTSTSYLQSPYWWLGQVLITVGEMGNFLAYGFAPASIVSPLGVVALISNCVIAPILFKEAFRKRDFGGVVVAIAGAVTVVLSAKQEETKLAPHDVWDAITTPAFEIYLAVSWSLIALLMWASPRYGNRTILIDLGLVGLFGAYTVLATKGVSSMLSSTLFGAFVTPMTYALLVVLLATAVMQVRYVNKALQRFDSTQVIPIQFVMFTLSVIIGSAVLYRDFERTTAEQAAKFIGGCLLTFFGVFIITSGRPSAGHDADEDDDSDSDGIEDGVNMASGEGTGAGLGYGIDLDEDASPLIGVDGRGEAIYLANQGTAASKRPPSSMSALSASGSRRSSRASRVSFAGTFGGTLNSRPFPPLPADSGVPSARAPVISRGAGSGGDGSGIAGSYGGSSLPAAAGKTTTPMSTSPGVPRLLAPSDDEGSANIGGFDGANAGASSSETPSLAAGSDTLLLSASTAAVVPFPALTQPSQPAQSPQTVLQHSTRPITPTASSHMWAHSTIHYQSPMISPSPLLSSTVSAVVADTILKHMDGSSPQPTRRLSTRRVRPGLRSSLFVPQDELLLDDAERLLHPSMGQHHQHQQHQQHQQQYYQHHYQQGASNESLVPVVTAGTEGGGEPTAAAAAGSGSSSAGLGAVVVAGEAGPLSSSRRAKSGGSMRDRARSLSNAFGGLFWARPRRRRNSSPESSGGGGEDGGGNGTEYTLSEDVPSTALPAERDV